MTLCSTELDGACRRGSRIREKSGGTWCHNAEVENSCQSLTLFLLLTCRFRTPIRWRWFPLDQRKAIQHETNSHRRHDDERLLFNRTRKSILSLTRLNSK